MKKFYVIAFFIVALIGSNVFAQVVTIQRKTNNQAATSTASSKNNNLVNSIKNCKPYSENLNSDYMGVNVSYQVKIDGWVNNKCRLNFTAKANNASSSFKETYGIDASDATILSFAPKIRCDFTQQQLDYVGDSILQEEERNQGATNNMLKDPNSINFSNFGTSDMKLVDVVLRQQACQILNTEDLNKIMENLMLF